MTSRTTTRRAHAILSLALFLFGTNFCVFTPPASFAAPAVAKLTKSATVAAEHACCARARAAAEESKATPETVSPCCVAVAPVLAGHGASLDPAPMVVLPAAIAFIVTPVTIFTGETLALAEDAHPPASHAATPDAGRAPPRL